MVEGFALIMKWEGEQEILIHTGIFRFSLILLSTAAALHTCEREQQQNSAQSYTRVSTATPAYIFVAAVIGVVLFFWRFLGVSHLLTDLLCPILLAFLLFYLLHCT